MYAKLTSNGVIKYLDLVESYRVLNEGQGGHAGQVRQRHIARLGRFSRAKVEQLVKSLSRFLVDRHQVGPTGPLRNAPGREQFPLSKKAIPRKMASKRVSESRRQGRRGRDLVATTTGEISSRPHRDRATTTSTGSKTCKNARPRKMALKRLPGDARQAGGSRHVEATTIAPRKRGMIHP